MISVLLVTQDFQRAGAQRQCIELALGLQNSPGWKVEDADNFLLNSVLNQDSPHCILSWNGRRFS